MFSITSNISVCFSAGSDDELLADDDKRPQQQPYQRKKRRPSFKRRKKVIYDQAQTDSGIDSRMGRTSFVKKFF